MSTGESGFRRVLVANRGEIAIRVIRACRELGVQAVAVYGEGEERAAHVELADDAYRLPERGGIPYLDIEGIVDLARRAGVEAVHPGYGFLAENAEFAAACAAAGLRFVGPPPAAIRAMGDKVEARRIAAAAGVPIVPGTEEPVTSVEAALAWAERHGYPVAVKAAGGGGGRGFRVARAAAELPDAFAGAAGEAARFFRNPTVYLERYLERPRHIEIQVIADDHGRVIALGERDCSIQRRHQKLIEEAPSPAVDPELRAALGEAAVRLARAVDYRGAGTVEFLLDVEGRFSFLEMNTRIQVEHPVTELITGLDLVKEQIRIAAGNPLAFPDEIALHGHAIECRINAEDPGRDFAPGPGTITEYRAPGGPGVRVDGAFGPGDTIPTRYDSLIAKLLAWGRDREEAIARMERALAEYRIGGVPTTIPFHRAVLAHPVFRTGAATTAFLAEQPEVITSLAPAEIAGGAATPEPVARSLTVEVNGRRLAVRVIGEAGAPPAGPRGTARPASGRPAPRPGGSGRQTANGPELLSPLQGTVVRIAVEPGQRVARGEVVCVVEAMKMENELAAHRDGVVTAIHVQPGATVRIGAPLLAIEEG